MCDVFEQRQAPRGSQGAIVHQAESPLILEINECLQFRHKIPVRLERTEGDFESVTLTSVDVNGVWANCEHRFLELTVLRDRSRDVPRHHHLAVRVVTYGHSLGLTRLVYQGVAKI